MRSACPGPVSWSAHTLTPGTRTLYSGEGNLGAFGKAEFRRLRAADQTPGGRPAGRRRHLGLCAGRHFLPREHVCPPPAYGAELVRLPRLLARRRGGTAFSGNPVLLALRARGPLHLHALRCGLVQPYVPDALGCGEMADDRREHRRLGADCLDDIPPARLAWPPLAGCGARAQRGGALVRAGAARAAPGPDRTDPDGPDRM